MRKIPASIFSVFLLFFSMASLAQPRSRSTPADTTALLSHRWKVVMTEKAGKKEKTTAGSMPLYMNFFSNGGFDFVALGDGDLLIWKYGKGSVIVYRKTDPKAAPEADFRVEKINGKMLQLAGIQTGTSVRYLFSREAAD